MLSVNKRNKLINEIKATWPKRNPGVLRKDMIWLECLDDWNLSFFHKVWFSLTDEERARP